MTPEEFKTLAAAGLSTEQIALVMEMIRERDDALKNHAEESKRKTRERVQKWRDRKKDDDVTLRNVTVTGRNGSCERDTRVEDNNKTNNPTEDISSLRSDNISIKSEIDGEFEAQFWPAYPRKVSKGHALKAFRAARKKTPLEAIIAGLARYAADRFGEDQTFTKHAASWLNSQGWLDEPTPRHSAPRSPPAGRPRDIVDVIDERLARQHAEQFDSRTIEHEPGSGSAPPVRLVADATWRRS